MRTYETLKIIRSMTSRFLNANRTHLGPLIWAAIPAITITAPWVDLPEGRRAGTGQGISRHRAAQR
jgi:hypothetical protein